MTRMNLCILLQKELHGRKVLLYVWWDHCSIIYFEFLNYNQTLNADLDFHAYIVAAESIRKCLMFINRKPSHLEL